MNSFQETKGEGLAEVLVFALLGVGGSPAGAPTDLIEAETEKQQNAHQTTT